jgi:alkyl sulfatase BDS1-like metallo-beta-lactamase superfamily hydrolase
VWRITDRDEAFFLSLRNSVLGHRPGARDGAAATLASDRRTLEALVLGVTDLGNAQSNGKLRVEGDEQEVERLFAMLDSFPLMFDVLT